MDDTTVGQTEGIAPHAEKKMDRLLKNEQLQLHQFNNYSGPLPAEVLANLTVEQGDRLIDDLIETKRLRLETQKDFMKNVFSDNRSERNHSTFRYVFTLLVLVALFLVLLLTGNVDVVKEYIPYAFAFMGGSGIVLYNVSKKNSKGNAENISDIGD